MPATPLRRPDLVGMMAATPQHQRLMEQSALEDLLKLGTEIQVREDDSQDKTVEHIDQFHPLFKMLVRECIVGLVDNAGAIINEAMLVQVPPILEELVKRARQIPRLLNSLPRELEGPEGARLKIPLYRWLVPRLLHAASGLAFHKKGQDVGQQILDAVTEVIKTLGSYMEEQHVEGIVFAGELLRGLSESCVGRYPTRSIYPGRTAILSCINPELATEDLRAGSPFTIRTGTKPSSSSFIASQCQMDDNIATSDRHPLYPFRTPRPLRRMALLMSMIHVVIRSFDGSNPAITAWRDYCTDTLLWTMSAIVKLSETLRARSTVCGTPEASENVATETNLVIAKQQLMLFHDMLALLARPSVFPYHMSERVGFILAQAVEDRLRIASPDTDMDTDEGIATLSTAIDKVLYGFLKTVRNQRAGRASGDTWLKLLATVEAHLNVQDGTRENVSLVYTLARKHTADPLDL
jgi:hypothetical protein